MDLGLAEDASHQVSLSAGRAVTQTHPVTEVADSISRRCFSGLLLIGMALTHLHSISTPPCFLEHRAHFPVVPNHHCIAYVGHWSLGREATALTQSQEQAWAYGF